MIDDHVGARSSSGFEQRLRAERRARRRPSAPCELWRGSQQLGAARAPAAPLRGGPATPSTRCRCRYATPSSARRARVLERARTWSRSGPSCSPTARCSRGRSTATRPASSATASSTARSAGASRAAARSSALEGSDAEPRESGEARLERPSSARRRAGERDARHRRPTTRRDDRAAARLRGRRAPASPPPAAARPAAARQGPAPLRARLRRRGAGPERRSSCRVVLDTVTPASSVTLAGDTRSGSARQRLHRAGAACSTSSGSRTSQIEPLASATARRTRS